MAILVIRMKIFPLLREVGFIETALGVKCWQMARSRPQMCDGGLDVV
jgi:hypothetical protein